MKTAIITGITGQDGCYLAKLLLEKQYRVVGVLESRRHSSLVGLKYTGVLNSIELRSCDLGSFSEVQRLTLETEPSELYHLASQSSVAYSFNEPALTMSVNTGITINILEALRTVARGTRCYHASSSEMFGKATSLPATETTPFRPISPYAVSKVAAHQTVCCYRDSYKLFAVSGILFNHESILRRDNFFTRKLIVEALELASGARETVSFGNLSVKRDVGFAPRYVEAMWKMLQQSSPQDYLICSGTSVSLRQLVEHVFMRLGLPLEKIRIDPHLLRPNEIEDIYGCNAVAREQLDWQYDLSACEVMDLILDEEMRNRAAAKAESETA